MPGKSESSSAGKQNESAAKKPADKSQKGVAPAGAGYESYLGEGQPGMDSLNAYLEGADEATRARVVTEIQQTQGNDFVQRMLLQRQEHDGEPSTETVRGDPSSESDQPSEEERAEQRENWQKWVQGAKSGVTTAVSVWANSARLTGVMVNSLTATGGRIRGSFPGGLVSAMVAGQGAPGNISSAFGRATAAAWSGWTGTVMVPGLPWYPSFVAWPGPMAPPMPNTPSPLIMIAPGAFINSGSVSSSIIGSLGENSSDEGAAEAVQQFAEWLSLSFTIWSISSQVTLVMGKGPVPSFAPPYIPVGPVIAGSAQSYGPFLAGAPSFGVG
jgi:hypothetical protein